MKILYINSFYAPEEIGGAEKSVRFLAETLQQQGHTTAVVTLGRQAEVRDLNDVTIYRVAAPNLYYPADAGRQPGWKKMLWHGIDSYNPKAASQVAAILEEFKPDVVHTNNLSGLSVAVWGVIRARKIPIVHTLRDYYLLCPNTAMFKNGKPCHSRCSSCTALCMPRIAASKEVDVVVGNSHFILNKHLQYGLFKHADQRVIYNAYSPKHDNDSRPTDRIQVGFIGRIAPSKGIELLIDGLRMANLHRPFKVLIGGEGDPSYVAELKARAQGLPVDFLGRVKPEDFYSAIHWTIVPSIWDEPLARVLFESFAHGVPVLGTETGGTPELIRDGHNGYLFSAESAQTLATRLEAIESISSGPDYEKLSKNARNDSQKFTPHAVASSYLNAYKTAVNRLTKSSQESAG